MLETKDVPTSDECGILHSEEKKNATGETKKKTFLSGGGLLTHFICVYSYVAQVDTL